MKGSFILPSSLNGSGFAEFGLELNCGSGNRRELKLEESGFASEREAVEELCDTLESAQWKNGQWIFFPPNRDVLNSVLKCMCCYSNRVE